MDCSKRVLCLYFISFIATLLTVQTQSPKQIVATRQWQTWYTSDGRLKLAPDWQIRLELETDRNQIFSRDNQYKGRLSAYHRLSSIVELGAGFGYFGQHADSLQAFDDPLGTELRPHQEVILHFTGERITVKPSLRIEERFLRDISKYTIENGYDFNYRFRLRLEVNAPLKRGDKNDVGQLKAVAYNEVMVNAGQQAPTFFNQNRAYAGLNYTLSKSLQLEAGYINVFQKRSSGDRFWNRDVLRLTVSYSLSLL